MWPYRFGKESKWDAMDRTTEKQEPLPCIELMLKSEQSKEKPVLGGSKLPVLGGVQEEGGEVLAGILWKTSEWQF